MHHLDPLVHGVLGMEGTELRLAGMDRLLKANGWGFLSSLNEFIMCFQRAEMSWQGVGDFRDLSRMRTRLFTGRTVIGIELYFKLGIFWIFSLFGFKACCDLDKVWYSYFIESTAMTANDTNVWNAMRVICSSPMFLKAVVIRVFMLSMYPFMGVRTMKKIREFHREGGIMKKKKIH